MRIWFERGPISDAIAFGFQFCWEYRDMRQYRISLDVAHWYFNIYFRVGGEK